MPDGQHVDLWRRHGFFRLHLNSHETVEIGQSSRYQYSMQGDSLPEDLDLGAIIQVPRFGAGQKVFRRYTLQKIIGRGGMGVVWLAHDAYLETAVALKVLQDAFGEARGDPFHARQLGDGGGLHPREAAEALQEEVKEAPWESGTGLTVGRRAEL